MNILNKKAVIAQLRCKAEIGGWLTTAFIYQVMVARRWMRRHDPFIRRMLVDGQMGGVAV